MRSFIETDCYVSLVGLAVGDAFGQQYVWHVEDIDRRREDVPIWRWTDDTEMALSVVSVLCDRGEIDQDQLAARFGEHWDSGRGYGAAMLFDLLPKLQKGEYWQVAAATLFDGRGSYGNGGAMRVAPLGAHFAHDLKLAAQQARLSAEVTHANSEGIAGAEAVAIAAAIARRQRDQRTVTGARTFLKQILEQLPPSEVQEGIQRAYDEFGPGAPREALIERLGNGSRVTAMDTVPVCLWMAGKHLDDYEEALYDTVALLGDMDTNCAIVGGIVAAHVGVDGIPMSWRKATEEWPDWFRPYLK
jgi:ADP-ribosylglycohydrolase